RARGRGAAGRRTDHPKAAALTAAGWRCAISAALRPPKSAPAACSAVGHALCSGAPAGMEAGVRAAYEAESRVLRCQAATVACLLAIPLVLAFAALDAMVYPER